MNLLANLPKNFPEELTTVLQEGTGVRIERIVSTGHRSPKKRDSQPVRQAKIQNAIYAP